MRDLVERARNGDREAFGALVGLISDRSYALAARILRDSDLAEDAMQGALISVWRQLPTLRDPDRFEAWVHRVVVHACYAEARRRRTWSANVRVLPVDGPAGPDGLLSIVDRDELERIFRRLPIEQRAGVHPRVGRLDRPSGPIWSRAAVFGGPPPRRPRAFCKTSTTRSAARQGGVAATTWSFGTNRDRAWTAGWERFAIRRRHTIRVRPPWPCRDRG